VSHLHETPYSHETERRAIAVALMANAVLMVGEVVAAFAFHSLTLFADAVHLLTDVSGLGIALVAFRLMSRPPTGRHTFGLQRGEVLAAQANAFILLAGSAWVLYEAARRLANPPHVSGLGVLVVASAGLVVNLGSAWVLGRARGRTLNMRGAFLHLASDAIGSLGAMIAGAAILVWGVHRADPAISILIAALVLRAAWRLLRDTLNVLLEGAPSGLDTEEVARAISSQVGVDSVHHLHVWSLASDMSALSAHVVLSTGRNVTIHEGQLRGEQVKAMLAERFGIEHVTLELECHDPGPHSN
jgi:cobalt-zinc-cadmium efflux system protein